MHFPAVSELESFPLVADFAVTLGDPDEGGRHIEYTSASRGKLSGFPAWDHADRDLRHFIATDVPLGTLDQPYEDADESWRLLLFEHQGFVYVLEADSPRASDFPRFFRVTREQYLEAWAALIDAYNPITPLDGTEN